jgi:hypothetical protein
MGKPRIAASVASQPGEDLAAACRYELTLTNASRRVQGVWVIFERSRDMLLYYQDAEVRAFARRHDLALLFPFHCRSISETGGDMNVDPAKGLGRALFAAFTQLAEILTHPELARHFDQGAPWTFVVQNKAPHCCIMNAKALILEWLDAVVVQRVTRASGSYGFIRTQPSDAVDCPDQSDPVRRSWCRSPKDTWGGGNWSVTTAAVERSPNAPTGMMPAGWLPTVAFAKQWVAFVTQPEHPVTLPP